MARSLEEACPVMFAIPAGVELPLSQTNPAQPMAPPEASAPRDDAPRPATDSVTLSPEATKAALEGRDAVLPTRPAEEGATALATAGKAAAAEARDATRIPTEAEVRKLVGSNTATGAESLKKAAREGASVKDLLTRVPAGAEVRAFDPAAKPTIQDGVSFKWEETGVDGKSTKHMFEVHGPDTSAHAGPNSRSGNVARLRQNGKGYFEPASGQMVEMKKTIPEAVANKTHIPLRGNLEVPLGKATQTLLTAERTVGRAVVPLAVAADALHLANTPKAERPREAAGIAGSWAGAVALAEPCAVAGAQLGASAGLALSPVGSAAGAAIGGIGGGLVCGAIGAFGGGELGRKLYDMVH